ncbi:MAG: hypothetical protein RLY40_80 [Pseudomonadota bacterium]|jgi:hypothetical protein
MPLALVPRRGLEPPRVAPQVPETCVSTNFTTSANYLTTNGYPASSHARKPPCNEATWQ